VAEDFVSVLEVDPELAEAVPSAELARARRELRVPVRSVGTGWWEPGRGSQPPGGFLVLEGCIAREVAVLGETTAVDFLAGGDLVRPGQEPALVSVPAESAWVVLEAARLAVLDADFLAAVRPWPQVVAALLARQERRAEWLAHVLAISHLPRVETRVLTLFWLFADRWGRRRGAEVAVPIPLTHLNIARLVGAQRPTVTTVLNKLIETGDLAQERTGHWLLRSDPPSRARRDTGPDA
jgi:CRP/FNR family cyclic AMP-dependent transcriptional regulator